MSAVLRTPTVDDFDRSVIPLERELHSIDRIARLDCGEQARREVEMCRGFVEVLVDLREHRDVLGGHISPG
jgi:hypothetical protein